MTKTTKPATRLSAAAAAAATIAGNRYKLEYFGLNLTLTEEPAASSCSENDLSIDDINNQPDLDPDTEFVLSPSTSPSLMDIASMITHEKCPLLGVKSIGVDYGLVRTGVAVTVGYEPRPLDVLRCTNSSVSAIPLRGAFVADSPPNNNHVFLCENIVRYARLESASRIVVGLPLHKNGTVAEQTNLTLAFVSQLAILALAELGPNVSVELWDERYTSKEAAARAHARDPNRFLYGSLDADAACIILEHYYTDHGQGRLIIPVPDHLREACLQKYELKKILEHESRQKVLMNREELLQQRKKAIARDLQFEAENLLFGDKSTARKKKKKKVRR